MGFYKNIKSQYGQEAVNHLKNIRRLQKKINNVKNQKIFLLRCRKNHVVPRHIQQNIKCIFNLLPKNARLARRIENTVSKLKRDIINLEIADAYHSHTDFILRLTKAKNEANKVLPTKVVEDFIKYQHPQLEKSFMETREQQIKKFTALKEQQASDHIIGNPEVKNLSTANLPINVNKFLSLGPKFAIQPSNTEYPLKKAVTDIEFGINHMMITNEEKNRYRGEIVNVLSNFKADQKLKFMPVPGGQQYQETRKFKKQNPKLLITSADKGNVTVIMENEEYKNKMKQLIGDEATYKKLEEDPTKTYQGKSNRLVKHLFDQGYIEDKERKELNCWNAQPPRIYGNPKVHKKDIPLRPIVSCINSPSTNISIFVTSILNQLADSLHYNIKNSTEAANRLKEVILPDKYQLLSLDVTSLFTNVMKERVIRAVECRWNLVSTFTSIPKMEFRNMINFIFESSYFQYEEEFFQQIAGSAMGQNSSPIFSDVVMHDILNEFEEKLQFELPFLMKFVDDNLTAVPEDEIDNTMILLNSLDENIKFTYERESEGKIPFLDLLVIREGNRIKIDFYKKPTSSNRILNYRSHHPMSQKIGIIKQLKNKIIENCSPEFHQKNLKLIRDRLLQNNYPKNLVNNILFNNLNNEKKEEEKEKGNNNKKTRYVKIPYHKTLAPKFNHIFRDTDVKLAFYNTKTINNMFSQTKSKRPINDEIEVVYEVPCSSCDMIYYGQTGRTIEQRMSEHQRDILQKKKHTGLSQHVYNNKEHKINWEGVKIVEREPNTEKREMLEMLTIINSNNTMNVQSDFKTKTNAYNNLIQKYYKNKPRNKTAN